MEFLPEEVDTRRVGLCEDDKEEVEEEERRSLGSTISPSCHSSNTSSPLSFKTPFPPLYPAEYPEEPARRFPLLSLTSTSTSLFPLLLPLPTEPCLFCRTPSLIDAMFGAKSGRGFSVILMLRGAFAVALAWGVRGLGVLAAMLLARLGRRDGGGLEMEDV